MTFINFDVPLNSKHQNKNIKIATLDESVLKKFGFTNYNEPYWYYCKNVYHHKERGFTFNLTFNITFRKKDGKALEIEVLDETICQPYDYQSMHKNGSYSETVLSVHDKVQEIMAKLVEAGIITGYKPNDYI